MARVIRTAVLEATPEQVWEAVGAPDRLSRWLGWDVEFDVRPGGLGTAVEPGGGARHLIVEDVEPGVRLAFHWWPAQGDGELGASTVEIDLQLVEGGTLLKVTETMLPVTGSAARASAPAPRAMAGVLA
jgi:uncharacterized protein YndB with AHSA1/START domain